MQAIPHYRKMASVEGSSAEVAAAVKELGASNKVEIAGYNTPSQTIISEDVDDADARRNHMGQVGCKTKALDTSHFSLIYMNDMLDDFYNVANTVRFSPPQILIVSSMTGRLAGTGELKLLTWAPTSSSNLVPVQHSVA